jgi:hypothetical protein
MSRITELSQIASVITVDEDNNKNIGIGTTIAQYKLDVFGDTRITGILSIGQGTVTIDGNNDTITASNIIVENLTAPDNIGYATEGYVDNSLVGFITSGSLVGYATEGYVDNSLVGYATEGYVTQQVNNLVNGAPGALDTLNELASALNNDASFSTTITNSLAQKANLSGASFSGIVTASNFVGNINGNINSSGINTLGAVQISSGIITAISGIITYYGDGSNLTGISDTTPTKTETSFVATAGQTTFSISYEVGYIEVYLNGIRLTSSEYTASSGTSIILNQGASLGDVIDVIETATTGPRGPQGIQGETSLSGVTSTTSTSIHYPLFVVGNGSTVPYINQDTNYFSFVPSTGTLNVNRLNINDIVTATDFNSTSDINLKNNVKIIDDPLSKVLQLRGVSFDWKNIPESSAGVIAQDVEKVFPEIVKNNQDGYKSLNYNGLIGLLIEAIKEQQEQINILKTRTEKLENQN